MSKIEVVKNVNGLEGLHLVTTKVYDDERGYFTELYNQKDFSEIGIDAIFVQENQSYSKKGVLRGLHVQKKYPQAKFVRVISGKIYDVAVDMREDSETYLKWFGVELSEQNKKQLFIPEGFAHGFYVLSENATVSYKVTDFWHKDGEVGIPWNDPTLAIAWPILDGVKTIIAEKDLHYRYIN